MPLVANQHPTAVYRQHHHHHGRVAGEGRRVVAPPCPRSTARFQRSPLGRVESFRSWSSIQRPNVHKIERDNNIVMTDDRFKLEFVDK